MGFRDFLKLKAFRLRRFRIGDGGSKKRTAQNNKNNTKNKPSWMVPVSHGYHVVEDHSFVGDSQDELVSDFVVVQREQVEELELWLFGVFDPRVGDGVNKYMQSHLLDNKPKEINITRKSKETMRKAYLGARARNREADERWGGGSAASVMVINGERLVMASMGDYRIVVCKDGVAYHINRRHHLANRRHWTRRFFSARILACDAEGLREPRSSEIVVGTAKVDSDTEFIVIATTGVWEVMRGQEAVSLIRHIENAQQAAEYLAKEAVTRMSKSNISCLVIRFD